MKLISIAQKVVSEMRLDKDWPDKWKTAAKELPRRRPRSRTIFMLNHNGTNSAADNKK
ncbi:hypothetical protein [Pectobacterium brasiliense]|uniref:hypothetical protein n=1 Tax=Pectobacterium brasiliense TaxID=180957 RepID=UPI000A4ABCFE|nr:hypothetical protein [Pectobacterium brasiliense]MBN3183630.1 hypothetical protein [Pectobacterium brasiliense]PPE61183.1 hypothetical protein F152LOC_02477 [Pectobacterium brasiliense]